MTGYLIASLILVFSHAMPIAEITNKVFLDVTVDGDTPQRIVIGLFGNIVPKTTENFRALCVGD